MTYAELISASHRRYTFVFAVLNGVRDNTVRIEAGSIAQAKLQADSLRRLHGFRLRLKKVATAPAAR